VGARDVVAGEQTTHSGVSSRPSDPSRGVFISYRRDDAASEAGRLADALRSHFGPDSVFLDTSDIQPGERWPATVRLAVERAGVVVTVIGPEWILARDEFGRRRIDDDHDWVRQEIQLALQGRKTIVPLLVRHARMLPPHALPSDISALSDFQAFALRADYWPHDLEYVQRELARILGVPRSEVPASIGASGPEASTVTGDDFRAVSLGFDSDRVGVRNTTADEIREIAASLSLGEVLAFCRSKKRPERIGAAVALGVHLRSSNETRRDRRVLSALGELLADRSSLVRYRAAEVLRSSPALVSNFEDELRRLARRDENPQVRAMAGRALTAAGA